MKHKTKSLLFWLAAGTLVLNGCGFGKTASSNNANDKWQNIPVNGKNNADKKTEAVNNQEFKAKLPAGFEMPSDDVGKRLLREYGAVFVAQGGAVAPDRVIFKDEAAVSAWQAKVPVKKENVGGVTIELQAPAMDALLAAVADATKDGLTITPRGSDAARRNYTDTETLWASRVNPGLEHWSGKGRITKEEAARIKALPPFEQVPEIFKLESQGMYFSKDLAKSIIYSVAPPGTSQHLSMLALDVIENENAKVRAVLARHGWHQTVASDLPHFTYIGADEGEMVKLGLTKVTQNGRIFWLTSN